MEEKYSQFLKYNWKESKNWLAYYDNLFPTPPGNKIERYKRKFYKLKIDPDFDVDYQPPSSTTSSSSSNNNTNNSQQQQQRPNVNSTNSNTFNSSLFSSMTSIELLLMTCFIFSLPFNFHTLKVVLGAYIIRTLRQCGKPQFNMQYCQLLLSNEDFHIIVYSIVLMIDRFNYFLIIPICLRLIVDLAENIKSSQIAFLSDYKKYCDLILNYKQVLISSKANIEVANGFILIFGIFFKLNSFFLPIIYWQLMKVKYLLSPETKQAWSMLNQYVNKIKSNPNLPQVLALLLGKIQSIFIYLLG